MNALAQHITDPDPPRKATISRGRPNSLLDYLEDALPDGRVRSGVNRLQQALRPRAGANPINAISSLLGLEEPLGMIEGPAAAAAGPIGRAGKEAAEQAARMVRRFRAAADPDPTKVRHAGTFVSRNRDAAEYYARTGGGKVPMQVFEYDVPADAKLIDIFDDPAGLRLLRKANPGATRDDLNLQAVDPSPKFVEELRKAGYHGMHGNEPGDEMYFDASGWKRIGEEAAEAAEELPLLPLPAWMDEFRPNLGRPTAEGMQPAASGEFRGNGRRAAPQRPGTRVVEAAFFDPVHRRPLGTGQAHDLEAVDPVIRRRMEDAIAQNPELAGFIDDQGNYLTREQAKALSGSQHGESSFVWQAERARRAADPPAISDEMIRAVQEGGDPLVESEFRRIREGLSKEQQTDVMRRWMQMQRSRHSERLGSFSNALGDLARPVEFQHGENAVVVASKNPGGGYRLTTFGKDGPIGHTELNSVEDVARELTQSYRSATPAQGVLDQWAQTPEWAEGVERVRRVQQENEARWRASRNK